MMTPPSSSPPPDEPLVPPNVVAEPPAPSPLMTLQSVFREHHDFVWRTLAHLGVAAAAVDDATQDVFLVVHRRLAEFDTSRSMKSWLYGIARRVASEYRRKGMQHAKRLTLVAEPEVYPDLWQPHDRVEAGELVEHFLSRLDDDKRQVFVLAEVEGMTAPEIAEALELNVNTVYARIRAARLRFAKLVRKRQLQTERSSLCRT